MAKDAAISVRLELGLKATLESFAQADNRTLSQYVATLLIQHAADRAKPVKPARKTTGS